MVVGEFTIGERGQIMSGARTVAQMIITSGNHKQMMEERALFLAAPDLLAALQNILDATGTEEGEGEYRADDREGCLDYVEATARAAIAKALGQEAGE